MIERHHFRLTLIPAAYLLIFGTAASEWKFAGLLAAIFGTAIWLSFELFIEPIKPSSDCRRKFVTVARSIMWTLMALVFLAGIFLANERGIRTGLPRIVSSWVTAEVLALKGDPNMRVVRFEERPFAAVLSDASLIGVRDPGTKQLMFFGVGDFAGKSSEKFTSSASVLLQRVVIMAGIVCVVVLLIAWIAEVLFWPILEQTKTSLDDKAAPKT